ncbi:NAD(P)H-dependent oxidoreductase [Lacticaseibacillus baoqingensis]|uniref:NAD(P)H-dependent oxidoreductase n=1 Tax=Lacticaseibacillus baoqingensis TaxID=2486013 RepID=A0ABW4E7L8_9LACO|nr:NAD(P)H-dependent oxidoreductase [Lacticaseibacillus baoqingensis]
MKTLIIVAHPDLDGSSTQAFLKASAAGVTAATWHPVTMSVAAERQALLAAERIVVQFPLYWYAAPALLQAWLAAVWTLPFARQLAGKSFGVVVSLGRPLRDFHPGAAVGVSLDALLSPFAALAQTAGMALLPPLAIPQFAYQTEAQKARLLVRYQQYLSLAAPESFQQQAAWWQTQLAQSPEAGLLADTLAQRQARLASLRAALKEVKDDE